MDDYNKEAMEFLRKNNISLKITFVKKDFHTPFGDDEIRNVYRFTLTSGKGKYWALFGDSIHNLENNIVPNEYDILACLDLDYSEDLEDFCGNYGYEYYTENNHGNMVINPNARKIYHAVLKQNAGLKRVFSEKQLQELQEIN